MSVFTYHLLKTNLQTTFSSIWNPPKAAQVPGLVHSESMMGMTLGSGIFSTKRILPNQLAFFAQWEDEEYIDQFLAEHSFGLKLSAGWHLRLSFLRQWGTIDGFKIYSNDVWSDPEEPVVAVTLARMKLLQVPRFIYWGRPVEKLVRDHPATTLALATTRLPRTVSTFSLWKSQKDMVNMVHGHSAVEKPKRHTLAMKERERKDFHTQFTTLRFKPLSEHGEWQGKSYLDTTNKK